MANSDNGLVFASLAQSTKIGKALPNVVADWLEDNVDPETGYVLDSTLTIANAAADAKAVGDRLASDGLTDAIRQALLQLAAKVAYIDDDDGQDCYDDLYAALYGGEYWTVTNTLTGCTTSNAAVSVANNSSYSATITASSGYTLTGATVSVTMGGSDITSTAYNNGTISIAAVTGALVISVTAAANEYWAVTNTLTNCSTSNDAVQTLKDEAYTATITASIGYTLTGATVSITMGGTDITSTAYNNGTISVASVTGALVITISAALDFPAEYQKVEYLQSSGSEYIDTGVYGDKTTSLELTMQRITPITTVARVFGSRTGVASNGFFLSTLANGKVYIDAGSSNSGTQQTAQCSWTLAKVNIGIDDTGYSYDGVSYSWASDHHGQSFTTPDTLLVFNAYSGGSTSTGVEAKLYSITIKKNGVAVFNGIPCYRKSDNEPGLYDTVSGTFFDNDSGSGAFTVGG